MKPITTMFRVKISNLQGWSKKLSVRQVKKLAYRSWRQTVPKTSRCWRKILGVTLKRGMHFLSVRKMRSSNDCARMSSWGLQRKGKNVCACNFSPRQTYVHRRGHVMRTCHNIKSECFQAMPQNFGSSSKVCISFEGIILNSDIWRPA